MRTTRTSRIVADTEQKRKAAPKESPASSRRHTPGMTTDAARKAVFNTSKLLESILVCLPPKTLFGVQRVSKQLQAIISTSIPIQEKMFLRLHNTPQQGWLNKTNATANRLHWYFTESADPLLQKSLRIPTQLNPLLDLCSKELSCAERTGWEPEVAELAPNQPISLASLKHRTSSILNTYISDPPSNYVETQFPYRTPEGDIGVWRMMRDGERGDGTIGDLIRNTLEGDGRAPMQWCYKSPASRIKFEEYSDEGLATSRSVLECFQDASGPNDKRKKRGIRKVDFTIFDMVVRTEAERAAVKLRGVEDHSNPLNEE